jgi:ABC-2 type transport system permease protein
MIRRLIRSLAAFPRFVLHDLRLSARSLASMFGSLSLRRLAALIALLFVALHVAAYPVAGWLIGIEDGPDGRVRITATLASGAALVFPWIVGQSIADFTRALFGRSDLELILASPVDAHALLAARALSISVGAVASVGLLLAPLADVAALRGHPHWLALYPALIAAGLAGTGFAIILSMGLFLAAGPRRARLFGQIAATAIGASAVLGAQVVAMLPEAMRTTILATFAPRTNADGELQGLLWAPVPAAAGDSQAVLVWTAFGALVFALACALFGERFARAAIASRRAGLRRRRSEGDVTLWRERQHGFAHQGAARRLARSLAHVATPSAGRLHDPARRDPLAQRRPDGHGRGRLHARLGRNRGPTRRRAILDRAIG